MTPAEILIDHIEARFRAGLWAKGYTEISARYIDVKPTGNFVNDAIACCVAGAVHRDARKLSADDQWKAIVQVQDALDEEVVKLRFPCIEAFNDHPETTLDDMLAVLQSARARLTKVA